MADMVYMDDMRDTTVEDVLSEVGGLVDQIYPVGSIYMSVNPGDPGALLGRIWEAWGAGRVPVGVAESEGGTETHVLTAG